MTSFKLDIHTIWHQTIRELYAQMPISFWSCSNVFAYFSCRYSKGEVDESQSLTLDNIRHSLIEQEDSIIFSLLLRAQYDYNADTYDPDAFSMKGFQGSMVEYIVRETEKVHAQVLIWGKC